MTQMTLKSYQEKTALVFHQKPVNTLCQINPIGFIINESFSYVLSTQPLKNIT